MIYLPDHTAGEVKFRGWALRSPARFRGCKTLEQCMISQLTINLHHAIIEKQELPPEALATIVGMVAALPGREVRERPIPGTIGSLDLVAAWGLGTRKKTGGMDINESRFLKWAEADSWDSFFEHSVTAMKIMQRYRQPFDFLSIYRWVVLRHQHPDEFQAAACNHFYHWQYLGGESARLPDAETDHDPESGPDLVRRVLDAGFTQNEVASRCGVTPRYLRLILNGERSISFGMQALLERLLLPDPRDT